MRYFVQAPYDMLDNYWLNDTINQMECVDEMAQYDARRDARKFAQRKRVFINKADRRKTRRAKHELAEKLNNEYSAQKWLYAHENNRFIRDAFAKKLARDIELLKADHAETIDFVAQRFINKYHGADTGVAMRTLHKLGHNTERTFTDWFERRMARAYRKYPEHAFMRVRAERRKYAQRIK